ncbi:aspartate carbamoyltransferase [Pseudohongiella spirulinae]|uniref:Aspartate carbamoyltransferase n=1 Tax=Pseudohongiella spirulinae TaxID=1249552 RepID=A0A0S2KDH9_9GAMM|nr:aspartate carbamoyltransferase [Pseudohongiella spirulinae]ALO46018.1 aspartate carbamoyltransferase [Pseudohongiella spirulinae]
MQFPGAHILSVSQFERSDVERIFQVADAMRPYAHRERMTKVLDGAILGNMFFEPSTRTRVSFGCAFNLLGGEVRETTDIKASSLTKGESLYDTGRVMSGYSDIIVMRHPQAGSVAEFSRASRVPVLNAGDGPNEHPSQALLDLYTIKIELKSRQQHIDGMHLAMVGDLKHGRTVHSLSQLVSLYSNIRFTMISPKELRMPEEITEDLRRRGHEVVETEDMETGLTGNDIVYLTRIQEERFQSKLEADLYRGRFRLNQAIYTRYCQPNTVIMHPLPRDSREDANELDNDLNQHPNLAIFRQTDNGVLVRMALFALTLDVCEQVDRHSREVNWYTERRF